ncbi:MAG: 50S ribosomal protein L31 [Candidatus Spechtbacteria bacterium]|nr:50S ribosomal protein L31 [Candidatus Spechtbacteria bacterium]
MKKDIHPKYFPNAKVTCACGVTFTIGATKESIEIETCSACHPFYTGAQSALRGSRVERFRKRAEKHEDLKTK